MSGYAMAQSVEALHCNSEGRGIFSLTYSFRPHYGPGAGSAPNRNEYQEHFLGVNVAGM